MAFSLRLRTLVPLVPIAALVILGGTACGDSGNTASGKRPATPRGADVLHVPTKGLIIFGREAGGPLKSSGIWAMRPDGRRLRPLIPAPTCTANDCAPPLNPRWSPDGRFIAAVRGDAIWRYAWDGTSQTRVTATDYGEELTTLAWSPSGREISFDRSFRQDMMDFWSVWIVKSTGGRARRIDPVHNAPDWARDGNRLVVATPGGAGALFIVDRTGRHLRTFDVSPLNSRWSPTGSEIALNGDGLQILDVATGRVRTLVGPRAWGDVRSLCWSPDGRWLAYIRVRDTLDPGFFDIWLVRRADGRRTLVHRGKFDVFLDGIDWTDHH